MTVSYDYLEIITEHKGMLVRKIKTFYDADSFIPIHEFCFIKSGRLINMVIELDCVIERIIPCRIVLFEKCCF